jgi:hypothetical protein
MDILPWVKFIFSKELLESILNWYELIRRSPDWRSDIKLLVVTLKRAERQHVYALMDKITEVMEDKHFEKRCIERFHHVFIELAQNGFTHGCRNDQDGVTFLVSVQKSGATAEIINKNKSAKIATLPKVATRPTGTSGRGLKTAKWLASSIEITHEGRGIKFSIDNEKNYPELPGITIVRIGAMVDDVVDIVNRNLNGRAGDVIMVVGEKVGGSRMADANNEVQRNNFVGRFAVVANSMICEEVIYSINSLPKLVGCYDSFEEAVAALQADPVPFEDQPKAQATPANNLRNQDKISVGTDPSQMSDVDMVAFLRSDDDR